MMIFHGHVSFFFGGGKQKAKHSHPHWKLQVVLTFDLFRDSSLGPSENVEFKFEYYTLDGKNPAPPGM